MRFAAALLVLGLTACGERAAEPAPPAAPAAAPPAATAAAVAVEADAGRYTSLEGCEVLERQLDEGGWVVERCPGLAGYQLKRTEGDARQNLVLIRRGAEQSLNLPGTVGSGFSTLGPRVEWRGGDQPTALILRYSVVEDPSTPARPVSYLAVARLTPDPACVIGKVPPGPDQNAVARRLADAGGPCLPEPG